MTIEEYINRIEGFLSLKSSEQIPYLGYYLTNYQNKESFTAKSIEERRKALLKTRRNSIKVI